MNEGSLDNIGFSPPMHITHEKINQYSRRDLFSLCIILLIREKRKRSVNLVKAFSGQIKRAKPLQIIKIAVIL